MPTYRSIHGGAEIDSAVSGVLNGTSGIQGVKVNGVEITPDSSNKVNITSLVITTGSWTPYFANVSDSGTPINPACSYEYQYGYYRKIGRLCYVTFELKASISLPGIGYAAVAGLPFNSASVADQALAVTQIYSEAWTDSIVTNNGGVTMYIPGNYDKVRLQKQGGKQAVTFEGSALSPKYFWTGGSGFYIASS